VNDRKIQEPGAQIFKCLTETFRISSANSELKFQTLTCANMLVEYGTLTPPNWEKDGILTSILKYIQSACTIYLSVHENQAYNHGAASISESNAIRDAWTTMFNPKDNTWSQMILYETRTLFPRYVEKFAELQ
jgi:hypothetical protein